MKDACKSKAFDDLIKEKENLSKLDNNSYVTLEMQHYLAAKNLTLRQKKLIFKLKCRMTKVGYNFGQKRLCPLCSLHIDDQKEMLNCIVLKIESKELYNIKDEKYEDIFSNNITKLSNISKIYQKIFQIREEILDERQQQQINQ